MIDVHDMTAGVAIIGAGRMGRCHIQAAKDLGLPIAGICDPSAEALALAGKEHEVPPDLRFGDARRLLAETRPACVVVATTTPTHAEYVCLAAESGVRYILSEKPMARSLAECDQMIETCRKRGARLAINHQMRFMEQYTEPKRLLESEELGGLRSFTVVAGNFGLAMNGTHYFEAFRYLTDESPLEVTAWFSPEKVPNPRGPQFEDRAGTIRLCTENGKRFYMDASADHGHGVRVVYAGRHGQLVVDELKGGLSWSARLQDYRDLPTTRYGMPENGATIHIQPADVVAPSRAVLEALLKGQNPPTGEDGRLALSVLVAAYVSDESGHRTVRLDVEELPRDRCFPWA